MPQRMSIRGLIDIKESRTPAGEITDKKTFSIRRPVQRVETSPAFNGKVATRRSLVQGQETYMIFSSLQNSNPLPIG